MAARISSWIPTYAINKVSGINNDEEEGGN